MCVLEYCCCLLCGCVTDLFFCFFFLFCCFFFEAEDGIRDLVRSRGLGDVYKRQQQCGAVGEALHGGQVVGDHHDRHALLSKAGDVVVALLLEAGIADGEDYLLRLFKKTGTPLDEDLKRLITHGLRRVRRVLSSRRARQLLVEVLEIVEDQEEIGILMVDPGSPICGSLHRVRAREGRLLTTTGRKMFWRNILRVAEGLALCHDAGIVHGAVSEHTIFSHSDEKEDFRLGGYEACVHIADGDVGGAGHLLRPSGTVSFRRDWSDLGQAASRILGLTEDGGGPSLLSIERRMLNRLADPPRYQLFDGSIVLNEIAEVVACLLYTSPSPRDRTRSRMPSSA